MTKKLLLILLTSFISLSSLSNTTNIVDLDKLLPTYKPSTIQYLQSISVTIRCEQAEGSGTIFTKSDNNGNLVNFVWTCAHVVSKFKAKRKITNSDGENLTIIDNNDVSVIKRIIEDGREIGQIILYAEVIKYSNEVTGYDLALLKIRKKNSFVNSAVFYLDDTIPSIGTKLYHIGSFYGMKGSESLSEGLYSQIGRVLDHNTLDQISTPIFKGSSGGGVFLQENGKLIGIANKSYGENFSVMIPTRKIIEWAKKNNLEWAINHKIPLPAQKIIDKIDVEDK